MNGLLSDEEALRRFNAIESGEQPWYTRALPMEGRATILPFKDSMPGSVFNKREWAIPGLLAEAINAFTAPGRSLLDPQFDTGKEGVNFALNVMGGGIGGSRAMPNPTGQGGVDLALNAWHGTPHNIQGKFDLGKVGTGEGAQAYGHGIYFAENPNVAKEYQKRLASDRGFSFDGKSGLTRQEVQDLVNAKYGSSYLDGVIRPSGVADSFIDDMVTGITRPEGSYPRQYKAGSERAKIYDELRGKISHAEPGNLYKVDIPDEQIPKMLDWDKPISKNIVKSVKNLLMSNKVEQRALDDFGVTSKKELADLLLENSPTGQQLYGSLTDVFRTDKAASSALSEYGIPGIRYLDEGSRGVDQKWVANLKDFGSYDFPSLKEAQDFIKSNPQYKFELIEPKPITSNFVSFQPETVKILEKNGINIEDLLEQGLLGN